MCMHPSRLTGFATCARAAHSSSRMRVLVRLADGRRSHASFRGARTMPSRTTGTRPSNSGRRSSRASTRTPRSRRRSSSRHAVLPTLSSLRARRPQARPFRRAHPHHVLRQMHARRRSLSMSMRQLFRPPRAGLMAARPPPMQTPPAGYVFASRGLVEPHASAAAARQTAPHLSHIRTSRHQWPSVS